MNPDGVVRMTVQRHTTRNRHLTPADIPTMPDQPTPTEPAGA